LHSSCFYGSMETTRLLLGRGADILAKDATNSIPFAHACRNSHSDILKMFFREYDQHTNRDAIVHETDTEGNTLLHLAVSSANMPIVELLLNKGANPSAARHDEQTAVHLCARNDSLEILEKLIEAGADINASDQEKETVLHKAATHNNEIMLKYILTKQVSENIRIESQTPVNMIRRAIRISSRRRTALA
jgi:ankyrin repeat protein